jgi:phosphotransferase system enzyme I (PtsP)
MGWRAIRMALDRPGLLQLQIRALLVAGEGRDIKILFPMIADVEEFRRAKAVVSNEMSYLAGRGHALPSAVALGAMIEVPALIWQLDQLLPEVDFASVGSNDLMQFLFASDRGNSRLSGRYDPLSPSFLAAMRMIVEKAEAHERPLTLCGELGGRVLEAMALVGIGFTSLSMVPAAIGPVKSMLLQLNREKLWQELECLLRSDKHSLREDLSAFASRNRIPV